MLLRFVLSVVFVVCACQQPAAAPKKEQPAPPVSVPAEVAAAARFDSPGAVYKRYAETLSASKWAEAIALFTPAGKVQLVLASFKGLALLPGSPNPKKLEFKAVMREFCQSHSLQCAEDSWNEKFAPLLLTGTDVTPLLSDVETLAKAQPEATYVEIMKLVSGVDQGQVVPLDPTLMDAKVTGNKATGTARRADGKTTTMSFENTNERGWLIVE